MGLGRAGGSRPPQLSHTADLCLPTPCACSVVLSSLVHPWGCLPTTAERWGHEARVPEQGGRRGATSSVAPQWPPQGLT